MAKRSPILGYNHNVRYRGLVFHVQTEDSGVLAPHLFTHLFHSGVIVSTRKYVYDSGATEEAIKSLMQAQHKAVMKELRRGGFDDKIDQYLGGTPGLLARGSSEEAGEGAAPGGAGEAAAAAAVAPAAAAAVPAAAAPAVAAAAAAAPAAVAPAPAPPASTGPAGEAPAPRGPAGALAAAAARSGPVRLEELVADEVTLVEPALSREPTIEEPALGLRPTELALDPLPPATDPGKPGAGKPGAGKPGAGRPSAAVPTAAGRPSAAAPAGAGKSDPGAAAPAGAGPGFEERITTPIAAQAPPDADDTIPARAPDQVVKLRRLETVPPLPPPPSGPHAHLRPESTFETLRDELPTDSQEILIQLELDDSDQIPPTSSGALDRRRRRPADTETGPWDMTRIDLAPVSDGIPGSLPGAPTTRETGPVFSTPPSSGAATGPLSQRTAKAVGAASLPPARPIPRPATRPSIVPTPVPRMQSQDERRSAATSEASELLAAAAAEPAAPPERPGQYSQHKKISSRIPNEGAPPGLIPQVGRVASSPAIPAPGRPGAPPHAASPPPGAGAATPVSRVIPVPLPVQARTGTPLSVPSPAVVPPSAPPTVARTATPAPIPQPGAAMLPSSAPIPPPVTGTGAPPPAPQQQRPVTVAGRHAPTPPAAVPTVRPQGGEPARSRTPTPQRVSMSPSAGAASGLSQGRPAAPGSGGGGVVMSRPAVIVGAPKPNTASTRVRKAREDEGRGFGQGLISEKSLDEVILAYLSEDAEDK